MSDVEKHIPEKQPTHQEVQEHAKNPEHPANPQNPKHHEWVKKMGSKFGNAAIFGAGASLGRDIIQSLV